MNYNIGMKTPAENLAAVADLAAQVQAHPCCLRFIDADGRYEVHYPAGIFPHGARASQGMGKALALSRLLQVMERHWLESYEGLLQ